MRFPLHAACAALMIATIGCASGTDRAADAGSADITFSNQIVRLFQDHCQSCHRPGGIGPFPLLTYADAEPMAPYIQSAVVSRRMPHGMPVRLETGCSEPDTFYGPRRLTQEEIDTISAWVDMGAPEGDPNDLPPPRNFDSGGEWVSGAPDFEFANAPNGFSLPAGMQRDIFRRFVIPSDFGRDRFITGFEALPGAGGGEGLSHVVHHVTLFVDPSGQAMAQEAAFAASNPEIPGPGFEGEFESPVTLVGMWFPGSTPLTLPDGLGVRVPSGAALVIEVHYAPTATATVDRTRVGLHLVDAVDRELTVGLVKDEEFVVPADDPQFEVLATRTFDAPVTLYSITPHMHQLGTDFQVHIEPATDQATCLADVEWDFEHQGTYWLRQPMELPPGSSIRVSCKYDNTVSNPHQFNFPPQDIVWGRSADLEMCQLTVGLHTMSKPEPVAGDPILAEVYYDPPGDDGSAEWIKLHNPSGQSIDLAQYSLGWGGTDYTYGTLQLSGELPAGACAIVGAVPEGLDGQAADFAPDLQNSGAAADAIGLFAGPANAIDGASVPIDAVIYGQTNSNALLDETGSPGEVDVAAAPPGSSLRRAQGGWTVTTPEPATCP